MTTQTGWCRGAGAHPAECGARTGCAAVELGAKSRTRPGSMTALRSSRSTGRGAPGTHRKGPEDRGPRVQQVGQPRERVTEEGSRALPS